MFGVSLTTDILMKLLFGVIVCLQMTSGGHVWADCRNDSAFHTANPVSLPVSEAAQMTCSDNLAQEMTVIDQQTFSRRRARALRAYSANRLESCTALVSQGSVIAVSNERQVIYSSCTTRKMLAIMVGPVALFPKG